MRVVSVVSATAGAALGWMFVEWAGKGHASLLGAVSGAVAGLCPITEANLGDGVFPAVAYAKAGGRFGIGTDSNVQIGLEDTDRLSQVTILLNYASKRVTARGSTATVGQTLLLDVVMQQPFDGERAGDELLAFGLDLSFDATLLRLTGVTPASGWSDDSAFTGLALSGSAFPGVADAGQGALTLATLSFQVLGAGRTAISLFSDSANNFNQGLLYLMSPTLDAQTSHAVTLAVPEPATYGLLLAGLGVLAAVRRRA